MDFDYEGTLKEMEQHAERRNFHGFGMLETEMTFHVFRCSGLTCSQLTEEELVARIPDEYRERFVKAKSRLLPNYRVKMPDGQAYPPSSWTSTVARPLFFKNSRILMTDRWQRRKFSTPPAFGSLLYWVLQKLVQRQPESLVGTLFPLVVEGKKAGNLLNPKFACSHPSPGQVETAMTCSGVTSTIPRPAAT